MLVLINGLQAGNQSGTGTYTTQLARWMPEIAAGREGWDLRIVWPTGLSLPGQSGNPDAFIPRGAAGFVSRLLYDQVGFRRDAARLGADVIHYPASVGGLFPACNMVVTVHDLSFFVDPKWFRFERAQYYRQGVARGVRRASRIIADSRATADDLVKVLRARPDRIDVIPLGVDDRFRPAPGESTEEARARYKLPERFFLYVGTLEPRKNLVRLIEAYSDIASGCPLDLVLAGRPGWKVNPIRKAAADSPHRRRIHFPGFISPEDMPSVTCAAEVFVYPSLYEGFGLPVADAMACGIPVLTSNASSLPEVAGDAALLVDPCDVKEMASTMRRLVEDKGLREDLVERGYKQAARFSWRRTAEAVMATYEKAVTQS